MAGTGSGGGHTLAAAAILGLCVLAGSFWLARSVDRATEQLTALGGAVAALEAPAGRRAERRPAREARRTGPDPDRVYDVDVEGSPTRGPEDAAVTLVEFSDFQCPFCARVEPTLDQLRQAYGDRLRIVFKHMPLSMHPKAPAAHAAAEAAHRQGRFWEMHDRIFAHQDQMSEAKYLEWAAEIGLDVDRFQRDLASPEVRARVERDAREAAELGVSGTPSFFVNGRFVSGALPYSEFKRLIDQQLEG